MPRRKDKKNGKKEVHKYKAVDKAKNKFTPLILNQLKKRAKILSEELKTQLVDENRGTLRIRSEIINLEKKTKQVVTQFKNWKKQSVFKKDLIHGNSQAIAAQHNNQHRELFNAIKEALVELKKVILLPGSAQIIGKLPDENILCIKVNNNKIFNTNFDIISERSFNYVEVMHIVTITAFILEIYQSEKNPMGAQNFGIFDAFGLGERQKEIEKILLDLAPKLLLFFMSASVLNTFFALPKFLVHAENFGRQGSLIEENNKWSTIKERKYYFDVFLSAFFELSQFLSTPNREESLLIEVHSRSLQILLKNFAIQIFDRNTVFNKEQYFIEKQVDDLVRLFISLRNINGLILSKTIQFKGIACELATEDYHFIIGSLIILLLEGQANTLKNVSNPVEEVTNIFDEVSHILTLVKLDKYSYLDEMSPDEKSLNEISLNLFDELLNSFKKYEKEKGKSKKILHFMYSILICTGLFNIIKLPFFVKKQKEIMEKLFCLEDSKEEKDNDVCVENAELFEEYIQYCSEMSILSYNVDEKYDGLIEDLLFDDIKLKNFLAIVKKLFVFYENSLFKQHENFVQNKQSMQEINLHIVNIICILFEKGVCSQDMEELIKLLPLCIILNILCCEESDGSMIDEESNYYCLPTSSVKNIINNFLYFIGSFYENSCRHLTNRTKIIDQFSQCLLDLENYVLSDAYFEKVGSIYSQKTLAAREKEFKEIKNTTTQCFYILHYFHNLFEVNKMLDSSKKEAFSVLNKQRKINSPPLQNTLEEEKTFIMDVPSSDEEKEDFDFLEERKDKKTKPPSKWKKERKKKNNKNKKKKKNSNSTENEEEEVEVDQYVVQKERKFRGGVTTISNLMSRHIQEEKKATEEEEEKIPNEVVQTELKLEYAIDGCALDKVDISIHSFIKILSEQLNSYEQLNSDEQSREEISTFDVFELKRAVSSYEKGTEKILNKKNSRNFIFTFQLKSYFLFKTNKLQIKNSIFLAKSQFAEQVNYITLKERKRSFGNSGCLSTTYIAFDILENEELLSTIMIEFVITTKNNISIIDAFLPTNWNVFIKMNWDKKDNLLCQSSQVYMHQSLVSFFKKDKKAALPKLKAFFNINEEINCLKENKDYSAKELMLFLSYFLFSDQIIIDNKLSFSGEGEELIREVIHFFNNGVFYFKKKNKDLKEKYEIVVKGEYQKFFDLKKLNKPKKMGVSSDEFRLHVFLHIFVKKYENFHKDTLKKLYRLFHPDHAAQLLIIFSRTLKQINYSDFKLKRERSTLVSVIGLLLIYAFHNSYADWSRSAFIRINFRNKDKKENDFAAKTQKIHSLNFNIVKNFQQLVLIACLKWIRATNSCDNNIGVINQLLKLMGLSHKERPYFLIVLKVALGVDLSNQEKKLVYFKNSNLILRKEDCWGFQEILNYFQEQKSAEISNDSSNRIKPELSTNLMGIKASEFSAMYQNDSSNDNMLSMVEEKKKEEEEIIKKRLT